MQMLESIGVIIIVTFLIFVGVSFYSKYQMGAAERLLSTQRQLDAVEVMKRVTDLPELQCSFVEVAAVGCMDTVKLEAFSTRALERDVRLYYFPLLRNAKVTVTEIYPCTTPPCAPFVVYENNASGNGSVKTGFVPITLYNPIERTYAFGVLEVQVYGGGS